PTDQGDITMYFEGLVCCDGCTATGNCLRWGIRTRSNMNEVSRNSVLQRVVQCRGLVPGKSRIFLGSRSLHIEVCHQVAELCGRLNHPYFLFVVFGNPDGNFRGPLVCASVPRDAERDIAAG